MLKRIISTSFLAAIVLLATASAMARGHWLLLALSVVLVPTVFGFRIAKSLAPDRRLTIWAGPLWAMQPALPLRLQAAGKAA